jgi:hypothetical protein
MRTHQWIGILALTALALAGCAQAAMPTSAPEMLLPAMPGNAGARAGDAVQGGGAEYNKAAPFAPQESGPSASASSADRLVVRNASLTVVVHDPAQSARDIRLMAEGMGGFVVSSNVYQATFGDNSVQATRASITVRVPAERLDDALEQIAKAAIEVSNQSVSGEDVTAQYTDLQSQLRNLESAEAQLRQIMDAATKTEDVMAVFNQLTQVQGQIESVKGQIQYYQESARLSAISVDLIPDVATQPLQIGQWRPEGTAKQAVETLIRTLQFLADAGIWTGICILPIALLLGLPAWLIVRAIVRRRRSKKSEA